METEVTYFIFDWVPVSHQIVFFLQLIAVSFYAFPDFQGTGVCKINAHIPLLLFVLLPPIPNYSVDDFVLRGAGRRRVSDYFAAACIQHFHVYLCDRGKGGGLQHTWRLEHVRLF